MKKSCILFSMLLKNQVADSAVFATMKWNCHCCIDFHLVLVWLFVFHCTLCIVQVLFMFFYIVLTVLPLALVTCCE